MDRAPAQPITAARPWWPGVIRGWPLWRLEPRLLGYVLAVIAASVAATVTAAMYTSWRVSDAVLYLLLLVFGAVFVEAVRRVGEAAGSNKDAHGVWQLTIAVLLPPFYALTAAAVMFALSQWRVRRSLAYRRVFSAAAYGLANGAASLAFHASWHRPALVLPHPGVLVSWQSLAWVTFATIAAALRWVINNVLVLAAVRLDDPTTSVRDMLGGTDGIWNDIAEGCVGVVVAGAAIFSPAMLIVALPCGTLLQRSSRHSQLLQASRTDPKTGLLSAVTWQREADVQVARAVRTRTPLAVAMIDIDHFKRVNDTWGHLTGDGVLLDVAKTLTAAMRDYDLAGRFGGEEFTVLLPHADEAEALRIAERLRARLATVALPSDNPSSSDTPHITVSIGVAALSQGITDLTELLTAADSALYRAKNAGRNTVRLAGHPPAKPEEAT
jgi:diguanylate cyclase (GGDEF)-like protein